MIFIVIPVHNRKHLTRRCLACLTRQTVAEITIVVVDDGSTDGTDEMIRTEFPGVVVLPGDGTLWWTEGTNVGVRYALQNRVAGEENFVLTINDDTEVRPDYVASLLATYAQHKPCLAGSVSVDIAKPDSLQYAGMKLNLYSANETYLANSRFQNSYSRLKEITDAIDSDSLPGRGVLIPFGVFEKVGLYDTEHYVHYMADIEFTVRAKRAGYRLVISPSSIVYEHVEATGLQINHQLPIRKFWKGLWGRYSPINIPMRYHFAMRHTHTKHLYLVLEVGRIVTGYCLRKLRLI
ncbi:glycosyltransferase family 2 protein [Larkinella punicea]|uniref:Glycosyltransferase family 2 protein n=1 Tax=Larkinella punicea TaxID=2315727 RepID=A0A368JV89_9BACT|nr:glycosyltransferase family 2 protein [Larkinella punicea]RCR70856.1 glycosyltransferase family 2 protein [Larkinella punicea]